MFATRLQDNAKLRELREAAVLSAQRSALTTLVIGGDASRAPGEQNIAFFIHNITTRDNINIKIVADYLPSLSI